MRRPSIFAVVALLCAACPGQPTGLAGPDLPDSGEAALPPVERPSEYVDTRIGSGGFAYAHGSAFPGATAPAGFVKVGPDTPAHQAAALMLELARFPEVLAGAAADFAPHDIAFYLRDLAGAFHSYYASERFLVDDPALARARIALLAATRQVLRNALAVLGVSAPQRMDRDQPALETA